MTEFDLATVFFGPSRSCWMAQCSLAKAADSFRHASDRPDRRRNPPVRSIANHGTQCVHKPRRNRAGLNFPKTVLGYLLSFLLFSGAIQVDLPELRRRLLAVGTLATVGVLISTLIVSVGLWQVAQILGLGLSLPWAFVFGALISPTDPIAVLAAVRDGNLSKSLEAVLQGEALLNDGVGIVVFGAALALATRMGSLDAPVLLGQLAVQALAGC
jgi:NhaP-type Na+/H+ or K+/H+ antiporter